MSDMFLGSQTPMYQNVRIRKRSKTGKILEERYSKNRVTRLMLYGIGKFLLGHFNDSSPEKIYEFIPRYLALGTNTPGLDADTSGVSTLSSVNDTRLLNEITQSSTIGTTESVKRVFIAERNMCKINTKFSDPFIKISIKTYISSTQYDGMTIGEAGLFSKEKDNNCLARVCFSPLTKNANEVLDIQWDITLLSYGETKYPDKLEIENGDKVIIPLRYTNKKFIECNLGLKRYAMRNSIGNDLYPEMFTYDNYGNLTTIYTLEEIKNKSGWYEYLTQIHLGDKFELLFNSLIDSKLNDYSNDGANARYLYSTTRQIPNMFYFGNLYENNTMKSQDINSLCATFAYTEDKSYKHTDTGVRYVQSTNTSNYEIIMPNGDNQLYKINGNRFYKKQDSSNSYWVETDYFLYNGVIVDINQKESGYTYSDGKFYSTKTTLNDTFVNQYLNFSGTTDERFHIYDINMYDMIDRSNYTIDLNNDSKIYLNDEYTDYHLSLDNYWVMGDYLKLTPIITPQNATDKSVTWKIQNANIATINWDGVVTAKNLGETTVIASTSNDLKAKCIVDVVKDSNYVSADKLTINPTEVIFIVNGNNNQFAIVSAEIEPLFATDNLVRWTLSYDIKNCINIINMGNNQVKLVLNDSGNVGVGYLTASTQSGKSAECIVRVIYQSEDECDCPDPSHLMQQL